MDGGTAEDGSVSNIASFANSGGALHILGGTCYQPYAIAMNTHLLQNNTADYCWETVAGSPHSTVTNAGHYLAGGLPPTYNFDNINAMYYQLRPTDGAADVAAVNGDGFQHLLSKAIGAGSFDILTNSPESAYWGSADDFDWGCQVVQNMLGVESSVASSRATFEVNKDFTDNNPAGVEVTISCNTGLPLEQSKVITDGAGVEFVVVDFDDGELDCEVTEEVPAGYDAEYFNGTTTNSTSCKYLDVAWGAAFVCRVTNSPAPVDVVIHKDWVVEGASDLSGVSDEYRIDLRCDSEILGGSNYGDIWHLWWYGEGDDTFIAEVIPEFPSTTCWVEESVFDSAVETDNGCGQFEVSVGNGHECTITNTVFFEGIPALNQYGLALLALLMLGVGFIGFRRFA
jgi:hypothetical protein